jgi:RHS repeat-associated protein
MTSETSPGLFDLLTAKNPTTGDEVTKYVYGTSVGGITPEIYRNDLLRAEIYPDSDDTTSLGNGADSTYDRLEYTYNIQGDRLDRKDQNESVHTYDLDKLGRVTHDRVTTLGTGVDGTLRRVSTVYDIRGLREKITSYDNATVGSGTAINELVFEYNDAGQATKEYQEHEGVKDGSTLYVQYNFDTTASGGEYTKGLRPTSVRYPSSRLVHLTYGSSGSTADALGRVGAIKDDSGGSPGSSFAEYSYLGAGTIVVEDYTQPDVKLNYDSGTAGEYAGFDRFGRVVDHLWYDYGASANRDRFTYGYDRASSRLYRENTVASAKDEFYTYDEVNRLAVFDRGDLNANKDAISGTPVKEEDWGLDMTGNWNDFLQKTSGSTDLNQDRTHNPVNEITGISETVGTAWVDPVHDKAGNMTTVPKPSSLATGLTCKWDAWNRLVEVKEGATVVGRYEYDGLGRRAKSHVDSQSPGSPNGLDAYVHFFYNQGWQELESRVSGSENTGPETLQPQYQYVWSRRYIDAPVLRDGNSDSDGLCDDERLYYLGDANFNVTTLVNTGGDAVERYVYSPYGVLTIYDATWANTRSFSSYANVYTYTGRQLDTHTGLYYYRARFFSAQLGRFLSRDPVGYSSGLNLKAYAKDNPIVLIDPTGESPESDAQDCYDGCEDECYRLYQSGGFWDSNTSLFRYLVCRFECSRMCLHLNNLDPGAPQIIVGIMEGTGVVERLPRPGDPGPALALQPILLTPIPGVNTPPTPGPGPPQLKPGPQLVIAAIAVDILIRDPELRRLRRCRCTIRHMPDPDRRRHNCPDRVYGWGYTMRECQAAAKATAPRPCRAYYAHCGWTHTRNSGVSVE